MRFWCQAKPCPRCTALISKVSGCDQMFCTQCHTTYSWITGQVTKGPVHNPYATTRRCLLRTPTRSVRSHYFQWLFSLRNGPEQKVQRLVHTAVCEEVRNICRCCVLHLTRFCSSSPTSACAPAFRTKSWKRLRRFAAALTRACFRRCMPQIRSKLPSVQDVWKPLPSRAHYYLAFENLRNVIVNIRATSGNHANVDEPDNRDLRVRLQVGEIDDAKLRELLVTRDFDYFRFSAYKNVCAFLSCLTALSLKHRRSLADLTVYNVSLITFDNVYTFTRERYKIQAASIRGQKHEAFFYSCYKQLLDILHTANECLIRHDAVYGADERFVRFPCHPYSSVVKAKAETNA